MREETRCSHKGSQKVPHLNASQPSPGGDSTNLWRRRLPQYCIGATLCPASTGTGMQVHGRAFECPAEFARVAWGQAAERQGQGGRRWRPKRRTAGTTPFRWALPSADHAIRERASKCSGKPANPFIAGAAHHPDPSVMALVPWDSLVGTGAGVWPRAHLLLPRFCRSVWTSSHTDHWLPRQMHGPVESRPPRAQELMCMSRRGPG